MRLNVGCGDHYAPGWVNIDTSEEVEADVYASIFDLPYPDNSASHIYCGHVMEHLEEEDIPRAVQELERVLDDDGEMLFVGPDYDRAQAMRQLNLVPESLLDQIVEGENRWEGDVHHWVCTEGELLKKLSTCVSNLRSLTPVDITEVDMDWPVVSRVRWQCAVRASC